MAGLYWLTWVTGTKARERRDQGLDLPGPTARPGGTKAGRGETKT